MRGDPQRVRRRRAPRCRTSTASSATTSSRSPKSSWSRRSASPSCGSWRARRRAAAARRRCSGWPRSRSSSGTAECVVAFRARNRSKAASYGADPNQGGRPWAKAGTRLRDFRQWQHPFGVAAPAHEFALIARRHMHVYGTRAEHFGMQAVAQRFHASRNPDAIMRDAITLDDWAASRPIAEPIRLFDCSLENDGAAAVLVTSLERHAISRRPAVPVLAQVQYGAPIHTELAPILRDDGRVRRTRRRRGGRGPAPVRRRGRHASPTSTSR